jgi:hypothetical protein
MVESRSFIERVHADARSGVLVVTGGGSLVLSDLLSVPGASNTVLEASVPYSAKALTEYIGAVPEQACSSATARALAMRAFQRALALAPGDIEHRFGLAITASLRTTTPKRGEHRAFVAVQTFASTQEWRLTLPKGRRTRAEEERVLRDLALHALGDAPPALEPDDVLSHVEALAPSAWQKLFTGSDAIRASGAKARPRLVFPGAFNPLHDGHRKIAALASERLAQPVTYEICITNVDKPPLDCIDVVARLHEFSPTESVWLTRLPTFVEKVKAFRRATFLVGVDTIIRIADPKYYGGNVFARDDAIATIGAAGCRFLVFGRLMNGRFVTLDDLPLPAALYDLSDGFSEREFRMDVSSTALRGDGTDSARHATEGSDP